MRHYNTGEWELRLPARPAGSGYQIRIVEQPSDDSVMLGNIAFGEVWLCSGQSNMQMATAGVFNATAEIAVGMGNRLL